MVFIYHTFCLKSTKSMDQSSLAQSSQIHLNQRSFKMYRSSSLMYLLLIFFTVYILLNVNHSSEVPLEKVDQKTRIKRQSGHDDSFEVKKSWKSLVLNACCGRNQILDDNLECVDNGGKESNMKSLVGTVVVNEEMEMSKDTKIWFNYGRKSICSREDLYDMTIFGIILFPVIRWDLDIQDTFYISAKDGSFLMLDEYRKNSSSFNVDAYCLNEISKNNSRPFVGLLCPCNDRLCIQKCCENGYYFNTIENKCKMNDGVGNFKPTFYKENVVLQGNESRKFLLKYASPKCNKPDELIIKGDVNDTLIYLQLNGFLMVNSVIEGTYYFYDGTRYCLDIFSNGTAVDSIVNGFHCTEDPVVHFVYRHNTETITEFTNAEIQELKKEKKIAEPNSKQLPRVNGEERLNLTDLTTTLLYVVYVLFVNVILFDM